LRAISFQRVTPNTTTATAAASATAAANDTVGRSFQFDFDKKQFNFVDGAIVETGKIEAIEQWIKLYINTELSKFRIYPADYGVTTDGLVGWRLPRSIQISEIKRQITEGILTKCPCCVSVSNWVFDNGTFSFNVKTDTGEEVTISDF